VKIDEFAAKHWAERTPTRSPLAPTPTFLRPRHSHLNGRVADGRGEVTTFLDDKSPDKRQQTIRRLMTSPEYALHLGRVLDDAIQGKICRDPDFLEYQRVDRRHKPWDRRFS